MTISALARDAYHQSTRSTASPREVERQLLSRLTTGLVVGEKNRETDHAGYIRALGKNLEFWTVIAADVASETNQLPTPLRAQLFYLFEFTRLHTNKIISGDKKLTADPLIEINQNIIKGLQGAQKE
ncbi:MAG: flagellar biosynthesis regulator FlaF [Parvularculaceae bacterium]